MSILITGGTGYIGSHMVVQLIKAGRDVVVLDNFMNSKPEVLNRLRTLTGIDVPFYEADLLDEEAVHKIFKEHAIDGVIHFAGLKAVGESVEQPLRYYANNLTGTLNLCRVMASHGCKRMVFSSSATVYGLGNKVPFSEDAPLSATNPYGWTKVMIERILSDIALADKGWSIVLLRYFNPIGAHKSGLIGEDPNGIPNNLLPYISQVASGKLAKLTIHGNDYETPDGTGVRDYIHVEDLCRGHLNALDYASETNGAEAFNLGSGEGCSVMDVLHAFERASGRTIPYCLGPRRSGDIAFCYADPRKSKKLLGWEARYGLEEMCRDNWNFIQKNPNGL